MEKFPLNNIVLPEYVSDLPVSYAVYYIQLDTLTNNNQFDEAIKYCNSLIKEIIIELKKANEQIRVSFYNLLKHCIKINKQNYQACCDEFFKQSLQQKFNHYQLAGFFKDKYNQVETYIESKHFHQAICICTALTQWLNKNLFIITTDYQSLFELLLKQFSEVHEKTCFYWLQLDYLNFMRHHYVDKSIRRTINDKIFFINKILAKNNYSKSIYLYTKLIAAIASFANKTHKSCKALTLAWQKFLVMRRQEVLSDWLINNAYCLNIDEGTEYIEMYQQDLIVLININYLTEQTKLMTQCRLDFINLILQETIELDEIFKLRIKFCSAFDSLNQSQDNKGKALTLLGLAMLNAYEGNKQEMLKGFGLAMENDMRLKNITYTLISRLPFYMEEDAPFKILFINPLMQSNLKQKIETPSLR